MEKMIWGFAILFIYMLQYYLLNRRTSSTLNYSCEFGTNEASEGDEITFIETIENKSLIPIPWVKVRIHTSKWLEFAKSTSVVTEDSRSVASSFYLKSRQKKKRHWKLKCAKRGIFIIENITLIQGDLFPESNSSVPINSDIKLIVYPGYVDLDALLVPVNYIQGESVVNRWIIDDPFLNKGIREYTPMDTMNKIHWGATAKEGRLMVRINEFTSQKSLTILLNVQSYENQRNKASNDSMVEIGIKIAATILDKALRNGIPLRFAANAAMPEDSQRVIFTHESGGREHILGLFKTLAMIELHPLIDFEDFLRDTVTHIHDSDVIFITAYMNDSICNYARNLKAGNNHSTLLLLGQANMAKLPDDLDVIYLSGGEKLYE